jgi:hypothetical protein
MAHDEFAYNLLDELHLVASVWVGNGQLSRLRVNGQTWRLFRGVYSRNLGSCLELKQSGVKKLEIDAVVAHTAPETDTGTLSIELYQITAPDDPDGSPGTIFQDRTFTVTWDFVGNTENATATVFLR